MSERALSIAAIVCAIPYGIGILLIVRKNPGRRSALLITAAAAVLWPVLFFCTFAQLAFVIPVFTVYFQQGLDLSKRLSAKTAWLAAGLTILFFACGAVIGLHLAVPFDQP